MSTNTNYIAINNISILKFSGVDSIRFLQGQLSNDVEALGTNWQFTGYCSPKGRLLALLQLWTHEGDTYATVNKSVVEATARRLRMYVMRSKVVIEELNEASCVGLVNPKTASPRFSTEINDSVHTLNFGDRELLIDLSGALQGRDTLDWETATINAGEPTIDANNVELFVPQMVNLDLLDGINFKKGCYTGQEIVARMHYLGKLKQRMFVCDIDERSNKQIMSGEKILADGKNAGNIVAVSNANKVALAVIRRELSDQQLNCETGARLTVAPEQPYIIPE